MVIKLILFTYFVPGYPCYLNKSTWIIDRNVLYSQWSERKVVAKETACVRLCVSSGRTNLYTSVPTLEDRWD